MSQTEEIRNDRKDDLRENTDRDAAKERVTYEAPSDLAMPNIGGDVHLRWVRAVAGRSKDDDVRSIQKRLREGYTFVRKSDVGDQIVPMHQKGSRFEGVVGFDDVILMKIPREKAEARQRHYEQRTSSKTAAIDADLFKQRDPTMPLVRDRDSRESVTRGRNPLFDE